MEYLLLILACIVAYPIFMVVAYLLAKLVFVKEDEFDEMKIKEKLKQSVSKNKSRGLAHV